jgi:low temperature requirement protein LtrA
MTAGIEQFDVAPKDDPAPAWPGSKAYDGPMKDLRYFDPHRRATWLELFFDLIFVVALHDAGEILSETHDGHIAPQQFLHFVLVFLPLWWIWAGHTIYANRFDTDSRQHRLSTLLIMFLLIVISAQISAGTEAPTVTRWPWPATAGRG